MHGNKNICMQCPLGLLWVMIRNQERRRPCARGRRAAARAPRSL